MALQDMEILFFFTPSLFNFSQGTCKLKNKVLKSMEVETEAFVSRLLCLQGNLGWNLKDKRIISREMLNFSWAHSTHLNLQFPSKENQRMRFQTRAKYILVTISSSVVLSYKKKWNWFLRSTPEAFLSSTHSTHFCCSSNLRKNPYIFYERKGKSWRMLQNWRWLTVNLSKHEVMFSYLNFFAHFLIAEINYSNAEPSLNRSVWFWLKHS